MRPARTFAQILLVAFGIAVTGFSASAQEAKVSAQDVPAAVIAAFKSAYPNATIKGYAREKEKGKTFYEIESKEGDVRRDVLYHIDGSVAEIEETVAASDLPAAAQELVRSKYPHAVISKAEKTTEKTPPGDKVGYEVIVRQGKRRISLEFDGDGKLKAKAQ